MKSWTLPKGHIVADGGSSWTSCSFSTCFPFTLPEHTDITLALLFLSAVSIFNSWLLHQQLALLYEAEDKFRQLYSTVLLVTFQSDLHDCTLSCNNSCKVCMHCINYSCCNDALLFQHNIFKRQHSWVIIFLHRDQIMRCVS